MATVNLTTAQAGSPTSVQSVVTSASTGDIIVFPAGTYSWSSGITVNKSITLTANAVNTVTIQNNMASGFMISLTSGTDGHIRMSNLNFIQIANNENGAGYCFNFDRSDTTPPTAGNQFTVISTNCVFDSGTVFSYMGLVSANGPIFSGCTFQTEFSSLGLVGLNIIPVKYGATSSFNTLSTMGLGPDGVLGPSGENINIGDTASGYMGVAGLNNTYIENCTISNGTSGAFNGSDNSRVVIRHCTINDSQTFTHGQDTDTYGNRHYEVYNNTYTCANPSGNPLNDQCYVSFRGALSIVANNVFNTLPAGKSTIIYECQQINRVAAYSCQTAYPANRQIGSSWSPNSSTSYGNPVVSVDSTGYVLDPCYSWGNTGAASGSTVAPQNSFGYISIAQFGTDTCANGLTTQVGFTGTVASGSNVITAITITPLAGFTPTLTTGMGIYDSTGTFFAQGTHITAISGSGSSPTSVTVSANSGASHTAATFMSGFITQGRDIILGTRPGYTPFTFPHPLISAAAPPAPVLVQHVATGMDNVPINSGTFTVPFPNQTLSGNCLILGIQYKSSGSITSVKDSQGNSFTLGPTVTNSSAGKTASLYYLPGCVAGSTGIVIQFSGFASSSAFQHAVASEWYNVAGTSPADGSSGSSTSRTAGAITTTTAGDLIYHWGVDFSDNGSGGAFNGTSITGGSGFTLLSADLQVGSCDQYQIQNTAGSINPVFTTNPATATWGSVAIALKAAAAGTQPGTGIRIKNVHTYSLTGGVNVSGSVVINNLQFPSSGNLIVGSYQSFLHVVTGCTDSASNTYSFPAHSTNGNWGGGISQIFYAANAVTSPTLNSINLTFSGSAGYDILKLYDVVGASTTPFDVVANSNTTANTTTNTNLSAVTITPSTSNGLVINNVVIDFNTINGVVGSNFISDIAVNSFASNNSNSPGTQPEATEEDGGYAHIYNSGTSALTFIYTANYSSASTGGNSSGVQFYSSSAAAFKAASSGGTTPVNAVISLAPATLMTLKASEILRDGFSISSGTLMSLKSRDVHSALIAFAPGSSLGITGGTGTPSLQTVMTLAPNLSIPAVTSLIPGILTNFSSTMAANAVTGLAPATVMSLLAAEGVLSTNQITSGTLLTLASDDKHGATIGLTPQTVLQLNAGIAGIIQVNAQMFSTISTVANLLAGVLDNVTWPQIIGISLQLVTDAIHSPIFNSNSDVVLGLNPFLQPGFGMQMNIGTSFNLNDSLFTVALPSFPSRFPFPPGNRRHHFGRNEL